MNPHDATEIAYKNGYEQGKADAAREIFEEIEQETKNHGICYTQRKIAELKKKHTEGRNVTLNK